MRLTMMKAKIHRATVTDCNLDYEGSIAIDPDILEAAGILPFEQVDIYNINNGERIHTYVISGQRGSRQIGLNGAAARKAIKGDKIIIVSYCSLPAEQARNYNPTVVLMGDDNVIEKFEK